MTRIWIALTLLPALAHADETNLRPYIIGARAAGMGGANTALADDSTGPYYNPAGIAFASHSSLSLSASVYGIVSGADANVLGAGHDYRFSDLNTFPVSTAIVRKFGARDTPDGSQNSSLGFAVFVPDAMQIDDRDHIGSSQNAFFLSGINQTVWAGATYARRFGRLAIGASVFGLLGSEIEFLDITQAPNMTNFATITTRIDKSTKGAVAAAGVRYDATDQLHLGVSVYSPEIGFGSRRVYTRVTLAADGANPDREILEASNDDLHATPSLPVRVQAGFAWTGKRWAIAGDAIYRGPRTVRDDTDRAMDGLDQRIVLDSAIDGSLGFEYVFAGSLPVRAGAFTDFSQAPDPVSHVAGMPDPNPSDSERVDRYGGTMSIGYRTDHTETDVGAIVSYGIGHTDAPNLSTLDLTSEPTRATQRLMYVFIASSYSF